jgi:hypothetical protein
MNDVINNRPCKFAQHWNEYLGERWMGSCPMFECCYDGEADMSFMDDDKFICNEDRTCPLYEPVPLYYCHKHNEIYYDGCPKCEDEMFNYEGDER